jgi:hypothetical protein
MSEISDADLRVMIEAMASALDLPVRADNYAMVESHLRIAFRMADFVGSFELPEDAEPAPVFTA